MENFSPIPLKRSEVENAYYEIIPDIDAEKNFLELKEKISILNLSAPLKAIINAMLDEQAALLKERLLRERGQKDIGKTSESRAKILKSIADIITDYERYYNKNKSIDLSSPQMKTIFKMLLDIVGMSLDSINISNEQKKLFFNELSKNLDGWEKRVEEELNKG